MDECSDIFEEYYMWKINEFKENVLASPDGKGQQEVTSITEEHH